MEFALLCVGQTIRRHLAGNLMPLSDCLPSIKTVLEPLPFAIYWTHRVQFWRASRLFTVPLFFRGILETGTLLWNSRHLGL